MKNETYCILVSYYGVFGPPRPNKLVTSRHLAPPVDRLERSEVESETVRGVGPAGVEVSVERTRIGHGWSLVSL